MYHMQPDCEIITTPTTESTKFRYIRWWAFCEWIAQRLGRHPEDIADLDITKEVYASEVDKTDDMESCLAFIQFKLITSSL